MEGTWDGGHMGWRAHGMYAGAHHYCIHRQTEGTANYTMPGQILFNNKYFNHRVG